jgi:hypothetical protein
LDEKVVSHPWRVQEFRKNPLKNHKNILLLIFLFLFDFNPFFSHSDYLNSLSSLFPSISLLHLTSIPFDARQMPKVNIRDNITNAN